MIEVVILSAITNSVGDTLSWVIYSFRVWYPCPFQDRGFYFPGRVIAGRQPSFPNLRKKNRWGPIITGS